MATIPPSSRSAPPHTPRKRFLSGSAAAVTHSGRRSARDRWRRRGKRLTILGGAFVAIWLAATYAAVVYMTGRATPLRSEPAPTVVWGAIEPFRLKSADGQELGAWFIPGRRSDLPAVLILHGNGGSRTGCLPEAELLAGAGAPVLMVTMRAHGDSTGDHNDIGLSARFDAAAAVDWLSIRLPGRPIVVWGRSLGSAAALFAAPLFGDRVAGYILECPFEDLRIAVRNRLELYFPPVVDDFLYCGASTVAPLVLADVDAVSPVRAAAHVPASAQVLVLAGGADKLATPAEAERIAKTLGSRAELVVFPRGKHLALFEADPIGCRAAVLGFVERFRTPAARTSLKPPPAANATAAR